MNGAVPITAQQVDGMLVQLKEALVSELRHMTAVRQQPEVPTNAVGESPVDPASEQLYHWGGRYHFFPSTFNFPKGNVKLLWDLWWIGQPSDSIAPYKKLRSYDLKLSDRTNWSKCTYVITTLVEDAIRLGEIESAKDVESMRPSRRDSLFSAVFMNMCKDVFNEDDVEKLDRRRVGELSYSRMYDVIKSKHKRKRQEEEDENDNDLNLINI